VKGVLTGSSTHSTRGGVPLPPPPQILSFDLQSYRLTYSDQIWHGNLPWDMKKFSVARLPGPPSGFRCVSSAVVECRPTRSPNAILVNRLFIQIG